MISDNAVYAEVCKPTGLFAFEWDIAQHAV